MTDNSCRLAGTPVPPSHAEALTSVVRLLSRRDHSRRELVAKLQRKGHASAAIDYALSRCSQLGYLDDDRTARTMAAHLADRGYGPRYIRQALQQKGIGEQSIASAMAGHDDETRQLQSARQMLQKKQARLERETDVRKRDQWAYRYLTGRGFAPSVIRQAIDDL